MPEMVRLAVCRHIESGVAVGCQTRKKAHLSRQGMPLTSGSMYMQFPVLVNASE